MTKFDKTKFTTSGDYVHYNGEFVARFKHKGPITKAKFLKELIANHTVETYFHELQINHRAPLAILRDANPDWYYGILEAFSGRKLTRV